MAHGQCSAMLAICTLVLAVFMSGCATMNRREVIASMATIAERAADAAGCPACSQMAVAVGTPLTMFMDPRNVDKNQTQTQTQSQTNEAQAQTIPQANGGVPVITVLDDGKPHIIRVYDGQTEVVLVKKPMRHRPNERTTRVAISTQPYPPQPKGGFIERALFHITSALIPQTY